MNYEEQVLKIIEDIFLEIPFIKLIGCYQNFNIGNGYIPDIVIKYVYKNEEKGIVLEVKSQGEPRFIRDAINQLLRYKEAFPNAYYMIAAPFISNTSANLCFNAGIGFLDLVGNVYINNEPIFIQRIVERNPLAEKRELRKLYSPKSERVLRVMLDIGKKKWITEELARQAKVSIGLVAKVKNVLLNKEWLESEYGGFSLIKPFALLDEWSNNYRIEKSKKLNFYTMSSLREIENRIGDFLDKRNILYAFTGQSAAARYAPMVRYKTAKLYIDSIEIVNALEVDLEIKQVESGANLHLLIPYDEGVLYGRQQFDGLFVVSQIQTYLDLINDKARGEEAAVEILEQGIKKKW